MDTGLSGVEFETPGRIASTVGENRLKSAFFSKNSLFLPVFSEFFLFGLIKTDRLLVCWTSEGQPTRVQRNRRPELLH